MVMKIFSNGWSHGFDGPGRRWVYYLKGCNFRCLWCGTPEGITAETEMMFYPDRGEFAAESCPYGAVSAQGLDREKCRGCAARPCVNHWHNRNFECCGREITTGELLAEVEARRALFGADGGVTFSGGEPTLQMDALLEAARALCGRGVHLTLENNASSPRFKELEGVFDLLICDLKCVTPELHHRITGADNRQVLENLSSNLEKTIRIPLIKDLNFTEQEREAIYGFLLATRPAAVEFLRLHQLGVPKYVALGQRCPAEKMLPPPPEEVEALCRRLRDSGIATKLLNWK